MCIKAAEGFQNISTSYHLCHSGYSPLTVSWLSLTSLPAAAAASFQTLRFPPATGQAAVRASSVSPTIRPMDEVLLQKLTVHHQTSCNRRWVMTSQAERPSAHGGVREIFLSLSVPGQRAQDWHRALLMKENGGKHQKLSWCQDEDVKDTRAAFIYTVYRYSVCPCECISLLMTSCGLIVHTFKSYVLFLAMYIHQQVKVFTYTDIAPNRNRAQVPGKCHKYLSILKTCKWS